MAVRLLSVSIGWDAVPGSVSYGLFRDGVKVSSTSLLQARLGVSDLKDRVWEVRAVPSGVVQGLKADWN